MCGSAQRVADRWPGRALDDGVEEFTEPAVREELESHGIVEQFENTKQRGRELLVPGGNGECGRGSDLVGWQRLRGAVLDE